MTVLGSLFSTAFLACLLQNLIFTGGYGADEALRMAAKPRQLFPLSIFIVYFSVLTPFSCALLEKIPAVRAMGIYGHAVLYVAMLSLIYCITTIFVLYVFKAKKRTVRRVGIAAFNTLVLALPFITYRAAFGMVEAIGIGIGAGLAFVIAVLLMNAGLRAISQNEHIPEAFKGTPAIFLYAALLSLAFAGFTGRSLSL